MGTKLLPKHRRKIVKTGLAVLILSVMMFWNFRYLLGIKFCPRRIISEGAGNKHFKSMQNRFSEIYQKGSWGTLKGKGYSGLGSLPSRTIGYRRFLEKFLRDYEVQSVLDAACGDWTFSRLIDWGPVKTYIGIDITPSVIQQNKMKYERKDSHGRAFHFEIKSITDATIAAADVVIVKEVLMHLPINIAKQAMDNFLQTKKINEKTICKFKYILTSNCVFSNTSVNLDINMGGWRKNTDFKQTPFNIPEAEIVFKFESQETETVLIDMRKRGCTHFLSDAEKGWLLPLFCYLSQ